MNHHNLAPANLTKKELRRAQAEAHNAELRRQMEAGEKPPAFEFPVESIVPQHDLILIEMLVDTAEKTFLHLPAGVEEDPLNKDKCRLMIIAVGPGYTSETGVFREQKYSVGQEILMNPTGGRMLPERADKRELMMCRPDEVMAVIDRSLAPSEPPKVELE